MKETRTIQKFLSFIRKERYEKDSFLCGYLCL